MSEDNNIRADICLCWMPRSDLDTPSAALGLLKAEVVRAGLSAKVVYCDHHLAARLGIEKYRRISRALSYSVMGWEIMFAPYAGFTPKVSMWNLIDIMRWEIDYYSGLRGNGDTSAKWIDEIRDMAMELDKEIYDYLSQEADLILSMKPKIVGFSTMTQQRNASFALIRIIKKRAPEVVTMIGGAICAGETGLEFMRVAPAIDYVFSGEGDTVFAEGCRLIMDGRIEELHERMPYFLHRGSACAPICATSDLDKMAIPDYSDYFEQLKRDPFGGEIDPYIPVEGSRGCWWGEKGRCRFCGMHFCEAAIKYRDKSPERVWKEIRSQVYKYNTTKVMLTDCILSRRLIKSLPDTTGESPRADIFAECKSNMDEKDVIALKRAGFNTLQPGIESLSDGALKLMHKGAKAIKQIELLKFGAQYDVKLSWNILMALPGEKKEWYEEMMALMPRLYHLSAPGNVWPMILMRCSEYQEQAERFAIHTILPQYAYKAMDPDDEEFTRKTAIYLKSPDLPQDDGIVLRMNEAANKWKNAKSAGAFLRMVDKGESLTVLDGRNADFDYEFELTGLKKAVFERAYTAVNEETLFRELGEGVYGALDYLDKNGLIARINGDALALATYEGKRW